MKHSQGRSGVSAFHARRWSMLVCCAMSAALFFGCGDDSPGEGPGEGDAAISPDASGSDAGGQTPDGGAGIPDAGSNDPDSADPTIPDPNTPDVGSPDTHSPDADSPDVDPGDPDASQPVATFECPDGSVVENGWNVVELDGEERSYHVDLPDSPATNPAMIFGFHGFSGPRSPTEDTEEFRTLMKDQMGMDPNARDDFPFILVLMEDTNLQPLNGLDWDIRTDSPNVDIPYFQAIAGCLVEHQNADQQKLFAFGFSAGATIANLIHSAFPDDLRAIVSESGLWANEEENLKIAHQVTLGVPLIDWDWPALETIEAGSAAVLLTRGGPSDDVPGSPVPASLDDAGKFARDWLKAHGRLVIDCPHQGGHTLHPEVTGDTILDFFAAHQNPGPSPLMQDSLDSIPDVCDVLKP